MYIRKVRRKRQDGSYVTYVQLAESYRDDAGRPRTRILTSLGREDALDVDKIAELISQMSKLIGLDKPEVPIVKRARPRGSASALRRAWDTLDLDALGPGTAMGAVWLMVSARLLAPGTPEHELLEWAQDTASVPGTEGIRPRDLNAARLWVSTIDPTDVARHVLQQLEERDLRSRVDPILVFSVRERPTPGLSPIAAELTGLKGTNRYLWVTHRGMPLASAESPDAISVPGRIVRVLGPEDGFPTSGWWITETPLDDDVSTGRGRFRRISDAHEARFVDDGPPVRFVTRSSQRAQHDDRTHTTLETKLAGGIEGFCGTCDPRDKTECCLERDPVVGRFVRRTSTGRLMLDRAALRAARRDAGLRMWTSNLPAADMPDLALGIVEARQNAGVGMQPSIVDLLVHQVRRTFELLAGTTWIGAQPELDTIMDVDLITDEGTLSQSTPGSGAAREILSRFEER